MGTTRHDPIAPRGIHRLALRLARRLDRGPFARNVAVLSGGTALSQGLLVLASPVLTRLYGPQDFGLLAAYTAMLSILMVVAGLRYEMAIPLPEDDETAAQLLGLTLVTVVAMSLLVGLVVHGLGEGVAGWLRVPELRPFLYLMPLSMLGAGGYTAFHHWALRRRAYPAIARTQLTQSGSRVSVQVAAGLLAAGPGGLLAGDLMGQCAGSGRLVRRAWREDRLLLRRIHWRGMRACASRFYKFPLLSSPSALLNSFGSHLPALLLAASYGPLVLGWYALGQRVLGLPMKVVGQAVAKVYYVEASRLAREDPPGLLRLFGRTIGKLALLGGLPLLLAGASAPWLFGLIFGEAWAEAGWYILLLTPMVFMQFVSSPFGGTLTVLDRQDLHLVREVVRVLLMAGALVMAKAMTLDARMAIAALSAAGTLGYVYYTGLSWHAIARHRSTAAAAARSTS